MNEKITEQEFMNSLATHHLICIHSWGDETQFLINIDEDDISKDEFNDIEDIADWCVNIDEFKELLCRDAENYLKNIKDATIDWEDRMYNVAHSVCKQRLKELYESKYKDRPVPKVEFTVR